MSVRVVAVDRPEIRPYTMPDRFRHEITYFMSVPGQNEIPPMGPQEYWIDVSAARQWLEDGVFEVVSPLDSATKTEIELSEEHEGWLQWMVDNGLSHVRLEQIANVSSTS